MKNSFKFIAIACFAFLAFSCSSDDDPADEDLFVGTYDGEVGYKGEDSEQAHNDGKVTVVKLQENEYDFHFSDGIPNLKGVKFEEDGDNKLINVDFEDGVQYIKIDKSKLKILYSKDDESWNAD